MFYLWLESEKMKFVLIAGHAESIINFRRNLINDLQYRSMDVHVLIPRLSSIDNEAIRDKIEAIGITAHEVRLNRTSLNPILDFIAFMHIAITLWKIKPDYVLAYTIKSVIWSGISSRFFKINFYGLVTGLGFSFQGKSFKRRVLTSLVVFLYKLALKNSKAVIFQNKDNRNIFIEKKIIEPSKAYVVNGSGVDLEKYKVENLPRGAIKFLCISRLLGEKGLREYAEAAKIVKNKFPDVEFNLIGPKDSSPDAILLNEVDTWSGYINYKGSTDDVRPYIKNAHVYVLPSYHEGLPRSTLEAMSMGRPVLTTNAVGCKETVEEGINGFKVSVNSSELLAKKMIWFVENSDQIGKMGIESRKMAEDKFDVHKVNEEMLKIMGIK
jgi:glycosyltransferase involved in cell wall biosynthesis